jgi:hypothetical protein
MAFDRPLLVRCAKVVAVYLLALGLVLVWWAVYTGHQADGVAPLPYRLLIGLWPATGPFAFRLSWPSKLVPTPIPVFATVWFCWLSIVMASRLRNWPLLIHFIMAMSWCAVGFICTSLLIV